MMNQTTLRCTIANGQSLSGVAQSSFAPAVSIGDMVVYGIIMPASWTAAALTMQLTDDNSTFRNVFDAGGSEVTFVVDASRHVLVPPSVYISGKGIKVRSGTSTVPVNQGADREIALLVRYFT